MLGIDPGSRKAGWGLIDVDLRSRALSHVDNGAIFLDTRADLTSRLVALSQGLRQLVESFRPDVAAVEDVFVSRGARSALILGQARGAVLATLGLGGISVATHTAAQVKVRVTGRGRASKEQVAQMVSLLLGLAEHPFEDASDALGVALCHALDRLGPAALSAQAFSGQVLSGQVLSGQVLSGQVLSGQGANVALLGDRRPGRRRGRAALADLARAQGKV